jgi:hypothetical protein
MPLPEKPPALAGGVITPLALRRRTCQSICSVLSTLGASSWTCSASSCWLWLWWRGPVEDPFTEAVGVLQSKPVNVRPPRHARSGCPVRAC